VTPSRSPPTPRICWLTTEFFPPQMGGTGVITARLAQALAERGVEVRVITRQTVPPSAAEEQIGKVWVRRLRPAGLMKGVGWRAIPAMLIYTAKLMMLLVTTKGRYDLVIISGMKTIPLGAVPICRLLGKKCIVRIESPFELAEPISAESLALMNRKIGGLISRALMRAQWLALKRADRVIAISDEIKQRLLRLHYPQSRIARIPNAIDLKRFTPAGNAERRLLQQRLGFPANRTVLVYAGRLSRAKGVMMLMEALRKLRARYPEIFLVLVGSGKDSWDDCEPAVIAYMQLHGLSDDVVLAGQSDVVDEYMRAADLFISPSDYEGFGLTIVEALACGLPIVSTDVGVASEIVRNDWNGFLCPPKHPEALSAAIELALRQRHRWPEIGLRARESTTIFDVPKVIDRYVALCQEVGGRP
jgi:glycosyltransferase involved in cell wall biosynthesis